MPTTQDAADKAHEIASGEGGPKKPEAPAMREQTHASDKMENQLEMQKENNKHVDSADQVAGRKEKGTMTGLLDKLTGDPTKGDPNK